MTRIAEFRSKTYVPYLAFTILYIITRHFGTIVMLNERPIRRRFFCQISGVLIPSALVGCNRKSSIEVHGADEKPIVAKLIVVDRENKSIADKVTHQESLWFWLRFKVDDVLHEFADPGAVQTEDKWYVWTNFESIDESKKVDDNPQSFGFFNRYLPGGIIDGAEPVPIQSFNGVATAPHQMQNSGVIVSGLNPPAPPTEIEASQVKEQIWYATVMSPKTPGNYQCKVMVHPGSTLFRDPVGGSIGKGVFVTQKRITVE